MDITKAMGILTAFFTEDDGICAGPKEKEAWDKVRNTMTEMLQVMIRIGAVADKDYDKKMDVQF